MDYIDIITIVIIVVTIVINIYNRCIYKYKSGDKTGES